MSKPTPHRTILAVILAVLFFLSSISMGSTVNVQAQDAETPAPQTQDTDEDPPVSDGDEPNEETPTPEPTSDVDGQIVGGTQADPGEWPWQVALVKGNTSDLYYDQFCGGSLIDPSWVLTAGHCVTNGTGGVVAATSLDAVAGIFDLYATSGYQRRDVVQIIRHPSYNNNTLNNDIALLKLKTPINIGGSGASRTALIPLAAPAMGNWAGSTSWVTGWGYTKNPSDPWPNKLREVSVPVITNDSCSTKYSGGITSNMLCAGYDAGGKDACQGDSGGPLAINTGGGNWVLAGIVSWGNGCALANYPGVYTRVSNYYDWVNSKINTGPPVVTSITRANANPTKAASVNFTVVFSKSVTGVNAADFTLTTTGVSGAAVSGVNGSGTTYTVAVNTGSGNGTIRLDVMDDDTITDSASQPLGGTGAGNGNFTGGQTYNVAKATSILTFKSVATKDGWVLESTETSGAGGSKNAGASTFRVGDDAANKQYRGILHFNTSTLNTSALFFKVTLKIKKQGGVGANPFSSLGNILVDIRKPYFGSASGLQIGDFQASPGKSNAAQIKSSNVAWYTTVIGSANYNLINRNGTTQFRLRFKTDDNNNFAANYLAFYSGNAGASNKPQLVVEYYYILP